MKNLLIGLNILLAVILLYGLSKQFTMPAVEVKDVKAEVATKKVDSITPLELIPESEQLLKIGTNNIFDTSKVASAFPQRGGSSTLKLVGISRVGDTAGAVILQSSNNRNNNRNPFQRPTGETTEEADYSFKQFIRLGETNSTGYTLAEVNSNSVILTRGGERLELLLQDASENAPQSKNNKKNNQTATRRPDIRDAMGMQMMMNSQMMMMMQRVMNQQQRGANGTISGSRGGSSGGASFGGGGNNNSSSRQTGNSRSTGNKNSKSSKSSKSGSKR